MATDLGELEASLDLETGQQLTSLDLQDLLINGVFPFNAAAGIPFELTGTTLDRDATALEKQLLIMFAVLVFLDREVIKYSQQAIVHSNVAGRTDLTGIEFALGKRRKELLERMAPLLAQLTASTGPASEVIVEEVGETLTYAKWPVRAPLWPYW